MTALSKTLQFGKKLSTFIAAALAALVSHQALAAQPPIAQHAIGKAGLKKMWAYAPSHIRFTDYLENFDADPKAYGKITTTILGLSVYRHDFQFCAHGACTDFATRSTARRPDGAPHDKDPEEQSCYDLGRLPRYLTNISPNYLPLYPDPNAKIERFFVQWADERPMIDGDDLKKYMIRKIESDFNLSTLERYHSDLGLSKTESAWLVKLQQPISIAEFSLKVARAFIKDGNTYSKRDRNAEYYRRTNCQYNAIEPVLPSTPLGVVNYNDPSLNSPKYKGPEVNGYTNDQNFTDISLPQHRTVYLGDAIPATDVLVMHRSYVDNVKNDPVKYKKGTSRINIAMIDHGSMANITGGPKLNIETLPSEPYNPDVEFSHAMKVAFRLAAPSNDGYYNAGVIPDAAPVALYAYVKTNESEFILNRSSPHNIPLTKNELFAYLSGKTIKKRSEACSTLFSCFGSKAVSTKITPMNIPHVITNSTAHTVRVRFDTMLSDEEMACAGPISKKFLDGRPVRVPIILASGNPKEGADEFALLPFQCRDHVIGVIGTGSLIMPIETTGITEANPVSIPSAYAITPIPLTKRILDGGNYIGSKYRIFGMAKDEKSYNRSLDTFSGTSFSAPTVAGTIATALSAVAGITDQQKKYDAPSLYKAMQASQKQFVDMGNYSDIPFLNSACFFQKFLVDEGGIKKLKFVYELKHELIPDRCNLVVN